MYNLSALNPSEYDILKHFFIVDSIYTEALKILEKDNDVLSQCKQLKSITFLQKLLTLFKFVRDFIIS